MTTTPDPDRPRRTHDDIDRELEEMLIDAEQTATRLRQELARRRAQRVAAHEEALQHAEIERLEEHLERSKVQWREVRAFLEEALREWVDEKDEAASGGLETGAQEPATNTGPDPRDPPESRRSDA